MRYSSPLSNFCLYFIADTSYEKKKLYEITESVLKSEVKLIQFRAKNIESKTKSYIKEQAIQLLRLVKKYDATFIINDHVELCKEIQADGVHLGAADMSVKEAREVLGNNKIIGLTLHDSSQLRKLDLNLVDYLSVGKIFTSKTKSHIKLNSQKDIKNILQKIHKRDSKIPVFCISGITLENMSSLSELAIQGIAICSSIADSSDPYETSKKFMKLFQTQSFKR